MQECLKDSLTCGVFYLIFTVFVEVPGTNGRMIDIKYTQWGFQGAQLITFYFNCKIKSKSNKKQLKEVKNQ